MIECLVELLEANLQLSANVTIVLPKVGSHHSSGSVDVKKNNDQEELGVNCKDKRNSITYHDIITESIIKFIISIYISVINIYMNS